MARIGLGRGGRESSQVMIIVAICALLAIGAAIYFFVATGQRKARDAAEAEREAAKLEASTQKDDKGSRSAFLEAYKVFMHPRCLNCHPSGDVPLQGDDSHLHAQNVKRGPDGKGLYALKCANCHQDANLPGENMPPGNPDWHLPKPEVPLVFQGKSPAELARQLKDPTQNGGKTLEQLLQHVSEDKLVLGGWDPGDGRTKPPLTHEEFVAKMREWVKKGAALPE